MPKKWKNMIQDMKDEHKALGEGEEVAKEKDLKEKIKKWANYFDSFTPITTSGDDEMCPTGATIPE